LCSAYADTIAPSRPLTNYILPVGFAAGSYSIKLIADYNGTISEINEANNSLTGNTLTVLP
jgi:hypothetical protein